MRLVSGYQRGVCHWSEPAPDPPRLPVLVHEGGQGLEGARERGLAVADAEVVRPRRDHVGEAVGRLDADARLGLELGVGLELGLGIGLGLGCGVRLDADARLGQLRAERLRGQG